ncbi:tRNA-uridine aminocarboxypropyltransferase [uncultured Shewanella sp.]|uniref:tRNA-uridine aminocarboxypropyltransferase n=1 Tax=uncultured Shewanella sp. TaxID=173975 RepID=UPI00263076B8|nr:tRNA-uridine aminocarboxypropyltransferase [uncultured Shewanella sp.]
MQVILLTHEREASRPTNTGNLALKLFPNYCQRVMWSRVAPSPELLAKLEEPGTALLFPEDDTDNNEVSSEESLSQTVQQIHRDPDLQSLPTTLVILDATWQEARKMLRQSPYLKAAKTFSLKNNPESQFSLRRNQIEGGLCTIECIIELFKQASMLDEAERLSEAFRAFCL